MTPLHNNPQGTAGSEHPKEHCEHECVCPDWRAANSDEDEDPEPCNIPCMQRMTRPHPAPALFQIEPNSSKYSLEQIVEINENIQKQRKEAAKAAREQVLNQLEAWCKLEWKSVEYLDNEPKDIIRNEITAFRKYFKSLRAQQQEGEP